MVIQSPLALSFARISPDPPLPPSRRGWQANWHRQDYLELAPVSEAVPSARYHVRQAFREWQADELAYDVEQVTAELVANAVNATRACQGVSKTPPVRMWVLTDHPVRVMVLVWDAAPEVPVCGAAGADDESGRGLAIVDEFSARWGWYFPPRPHAGKVVWSLLETACQ